MTYAEVRNPDPIQRTLLEIADTSLSGSDAAEPLRMYMLAAKQV